MVLIQRVIGLPSLDVYNLITSSVKIPVVAIGGTISAWWSALAVSSGVGAVSRLCSARRMSRKHVADKLRITKKLRSGI